METSVKKPKTRFVVRSKKISPKKSRLLEQSIATREEQREQRIQIYLAHLQNTGLIKEAARLTGINRDTVRKWRRDVPGFREREEEALKERVRLLEDEGIRRAMESSDSLLQFFLRGLKPEVYRDKDRDGNTIILQISNEIMGEADIGGPIFEGETEPVE